MRSDHTSNKERAQIFPHLKVEGHAIKTTNIGSTLSSSFNQRGNLQNSDTEVEKKLDGNQW